MVNADEALRIIFESTPRLGTEKVRLGDALGRTMGRTLLARQDLPPFDNSSMDGFALRAGDIRSASRDSPVRLRLAGESSAGSVYHGRLKPRQAVRIMTGGKLPPEADTVVPLEHVRHADGDEVEFAAPGEAGIYVRRKGEDIHRHDVMVRAGELIGPGQMGLCAALGENELKVVKKPIVNILATGNELVGIDDRPADGQIRNSTSYGLAGQVLESGGTPRLLGIAKDDRGQIRRRAARGLSGDVLLVTGGVSVGKYDLVKDVLGELGVKIKFWRVNIKPGKPLVFGVCRKTLVFGLPGNPVSTAITFLQFVRPALRMMMGWEQVLPLRLPAVIDQEFKKSDGKRHFVRAIARPWGAHLHVQTTGTQSSGAMSSMARANCLMIVPEEATTLNPGDHVEVELL